MQLGNTLKKRYIGSSTSEEEAARIYDKKAIILNGLKAKTNFSYTKQEVEDIINSYIEEADELWLINLYNYYFF